MKKWIVTGVSGSERIVLLRELKEYCEATLRKKVVVHDVGLMIAEEARKQRLDFAEDRILDVDMSLLRMLRVAALKEVRIRITEEADTDLHLIGIHATFRWKGRLLPGISYIDVLNLKPDGFINVVDDVKDIFARNKRNPKWDKATLPDLEKTQEWMIEEEFVTEVLADVVGCPIYLVARHHNLPNLTDLFFSTKKKIYLSYPITAVKDERPELLKRIQGEILQQLESLFVVFDPLAIKDMGLTYLGKEDALPELLEQLTPDARNIIKTRTVERDFQFIDQSDAVVVFYLTDKVSPGVLAEIYYAHRNMKKVFVCFEGKASPFLEGAVTDITNTVEKQMERLKEFAAINH